MMFVCAGSVVISQCVASLSTNGARAMAMYGRCLPKYWGGSDVF